LLELFRELSLEGEVAARTDDGNAPYLVVRVAGVADPVILPVEKARPVE